MDCWVWLESLVKEWRIEGVKEECADNDDGQASLHMGREKGWEGFLRVMAVIVCDILNS